MRVTSAVLAGALLAAAAASWAGTDPTKPADKFEASASASQIKTDSANDPDEVICTRHERTGSRIFKKECHTRQVWDQMTQQARQDTEDVQRRSLFLMGN